jgi:hypothetical protein
MYGQSFLLGPRPGVFIYGRKIKHSFITEQNALCEFVFLSEWISSSWESHPYSALSDVGLSTDAGQTAMVCLFPMMITAGSVESIGTRSVLMSRSQIILKIIESDKIYLRYVE